VVLDQQNRRCGMLYCPTLPTPDQLRTHCELVLLSSPRISRTDDDYRTLFSDEFMGIHKEGKEWQTFYVMFVRWRRDFSVAERIGIGEIHFESWNGCQQKEKWIRLG
jgi:hypothetical protein